MIQLQNVTVTPGSAEKHLLQIEEGSASLLRDDFTGYVSPNKELLGDYSIPTPVGTERGNVVVFFVHTNSVVNLIHPTHPTARHEGGTTGRLVVSDVQIEYNPLSGEIMANWD